MEGTASCPHCGARLDPAKTAPTNGDAIERTMQAGPAKTVAGPARREPSPAGKGAEPAGIDRTEVAGAKGTRRAAAGASARAGNGGSVDPLVGKVLGGCRIEELLGRGAMGAVYKATQVNLERTVAVKTIRPELVSDERLLQRFQREAKTVGRFSATNVVQIHEVGSEDGIHFLVMEFVPGGNLRGFAQKRQDQRIDTPDAIRFLIQACQGLREAQSKGVLHRDIKPDNLLLTTTNVLKIADFGVAKILDEDVQMTATADLMGTPLYMSPEQCRGRALDFRSDMYSLGASFYYLLTGKPPARGSTFLEVVQTKTKIQYLSPARALPHLEGVGPLSRVIEKMTALEPEDRYASYDELIGDLERLQKGLEPLAEAPPERRAPEEPSPSRVLPKVLVAIAVLAAIAVGAWQAGFLAGPGAPATFSVAGVVSDDTGAPIAEAVVAAVPIGSPSAQSFRAKTDAAGRFQLAGLALTEYELTVGKDGYVKSAGRTIDAKAKDQTVRLVRQGGVDLRALAADGTVLHTFQVQLGRSGQGVAFAGIGAAVEVNELDGDRYHLRGVDPGTYKIQVQAKDHAPTESPEFTVESGRDCEVELRMQAGEQRRPEPKQMPDIAPAVVDVAEIAEYKRLTGQQIDELEKAFLVNPSGLGTDVTSFQNGIRSGAQYDDLRERVRKLDWAVGRSRDLLINLGVATIPPANAIQVPFDGLEAVRHQYESMLVDTDQANPLLVTWFEKECCKRLGSVHGPAVDALSRTWETCRQRAQTNLDVLGEAELRRELQTWDAGRERLIKIYQRFPTPDRDIAAEVEAIASVGDHAELTKRLDGLRERNAFLAKVEATRKSAFEVMSLQQWMAHKEALVAADGSFHKGASPLVEDATVKAGLTAISDRLGVWARIEAGLSGSLDDLAARRLTGSRSKLETLASEAKDIPEFKLLESACQSLASGFEALQVLPPSGAAARASGLDVKAASRAFADAASALATLAKSGGIGGDRLARAKAFAEGCQRRVAELDDLTKGRMVVVAGGTVRGDQEVPPFFLDRYEVTRVEMGAFLARVKQSPDAVRERLRARDGAAAATALDSSLRDDRVRALQQEKDDGMPVDGVSYCEALAYVLDKGKDLPTLEQWWLAARGPVSDTKAFPWGDDWSDDPKDRNPDREPTDVRKGGIAWRFRKPLDGTVHHLAGNVAEWLRHTGDNVVGKAVGGSFRDSRATRQARCAGTDLQEPLLTDSLPGVGFRAVLEPAAFFRSANLLPE